MRIAVFASTSGTDLPALFQAGQKQGVNFLLLTNKKNCLAREKAEFFGIENIFVDPENLSREKYDEKILEILEEKNIEFIFLVGYMRIISSVLTKAFENKMLNIHPSLLPAFAGGMDRDVHTEVIKSGVKQTGATLHYVTDIVDGGEIFSQKSCPVSENETPESLKEKVQKLEMEMLKEAVEIIVKRN